MALRRSIFRTLLVSQLVILILALLGLMWYASRAIRTFYMAQTAQALEARARLFALMIQGPLGLLQKEQIDTTCKRAGKSSGTRFTVVLPDGRVIGDSDEDPRRMENHGNRPEILQALRQGRGVSTRISPTLRVPMMYLALLIQRQDRGPLVVRTALRVDRLNKTLAALWGRLVLIGLGVAVLALFLTLVVTHRIRGPMQALVEGAQAFAEGKFHVRLPGFHYRETQVLAEAMNQMAADLQQRLEELEGERRQLRTVLSSMTEGLIAVDKEERILILNEAAARLFGCGPQEARNRSIQEVIRHAALQGFVGKLLLGGGPGEQEMSFPVHGEERIVRVRGTALRDAPGDERGVLLVLEDITQVRRLERVRRDFVANASHEIKTPVTAIKAAAETLLEGEWKRGEEQTRFLQMIHRNVQRLEALTEDLLSLSRIEKEAEKRELRLKEHPLREVLETAVRACEAKAEAKGIGVVLSCPSDLTAPMNPLLLEQAVVNLLDNAVKYTDEGSTVWIEAGIQEGDILVQVRDQGPGIEKRHLDRLFERFYRVDKGRDRRLGGTGLGLAIVRHIMELHQGRVTVESHPGKGSTFVLHLPRHPNVQDPASQA